MNELFDLGIHKGTKCLVENRIGRNFTKRICEYYYLKQGRSFVIICNNILYSFLEQYIARIFVYVNLCSKNKGVYYEISYNPIRR